MTGGIVTFKSAACADVIYFGDVARRMMELMGKEATDKGILTIEQLPDAIARLKRAIEADRECHRRHVLDEEPGMETADDGGTRPRVSLTQRVLPLLSMLEESLGEKKPVVWGV
ncbi:MAG: DUF1840 domain-containing protein [Pseudomonadota bacterium]